jgi:hypothetical protein
LGHGREGYHDTTLVDDDHCRYGGGGEHRGINQRRKIDPDDPSPETNKYGGDRSSVSLVGGEKKNDDHATIIRFFQPGPPTFAATRV